MSCSGFGLEKRLYFWYNIQMAKWILSRDLHQHSLLLWNTEKFSHDFENKNDVLRETHSQLQDLKRLLPSLSQKWEWGGGGGGAESPLFASEKPLEWDKNLDFFKNTEFLHGELNNQQRKNRTKEYWVNGKTVLLLHDVGVTFYLVQKGDTIDGIKAKLSHIKDFGYISHLPSEKIVSFNIPQKKLNAGIWIPIPLEAEDRILSDEQFANYAQKALWDMKSNTIYGASVEQLIQVSGGEKNLVALMIAVAKQESGGKPLGQFEFHRWENYHHCFSYSIYHILMKQAGDVARRNLNMTKGQTYHPYNASKLFLAFLIEKQKGMGKIKSSSEYLPIAGINSKQRKRSEIFAIFYNGSTWKTTNPNYVSDIEKYYQDAQNLLNGKKQSSSSVIADKKEVFSEPDPEKKEFLQAWDAKGEVLFFPISKSLLTDILTKANTENTKRWRWNLLQGKIWDMAQEIEKRVGKLYPEDMFGVGYDEPDKRVFAVLRRKNAKDLIWFSRDISEPIAQKKIEKFLKPIEKKEETPSFKGESYAVQSGDTLSILALRLSPSPDKRSDRMAKLIQWNGLQKKSVLKQGQQLKIPAQKIAVPRISLDKIVDTYYPGWKNKEMAKQSLKKLNGVDIIKPGTEILVPVV